MTLAVVLSVCSLAINAGTLALLLVLHARLPRGSRRRRHGAT